MSRERAPKPALVLVPGLLCDALVWRDQMQSFTGSHAVSVPMLDALTSIPAMALALLAHAPPRFALAGHSLGGRIALEVMRQAPDRVTHLALLDTGVHSCAPGEPSRRQELLSLAFTQGMNAVSRVWLPRMVHPARHADRSFMAPLEAMVERRSPESFRNQITALLDRPDATPVLATIRCPTLVLCGREDGWSPVEQHEAIAAAVADSRLAIVDDCGHMAPIERPAEINRELQRWLASTTLAAQRSSIDTIHRPTGSKHG
jgi:pimeloyl-ACP methyl ester carboxylesterase